CGKGSVHIDIDLGAYVDRAHHLELHDLAAQLRVDYGPKLFDYLLVGRHGRAPPIFSKPLPRPSLEAGTGARIADGPHTGPGGLREERLLLSAGRPVGEPTCRWVRQKL